MLCLTFPIQGAASFKNVYYDDDTDNIVLPTDIDEKFTIGILTQELFESGGFALGCSQDGEVGELALAVVVDGVQYTAEDFNNMSLKQFLQVTKSVKKTQEADYE